MKKKNACRENYTPAGRRFQLAMFKGGLEVIVEAKHDVVAVEVETPVFRCAVVFSRAVAALITEEADVSHEAELVVDIK